MGEVLHVWALAPATVGACCVAADRGRARVPELGAAALMLLAMADAATGAAVLAPVLWAAILLAAAIALAAVRGGRRRGAAEAAGRAPHPSRAMTVLTGLGLVVMATLLVAMAASAPAGEILAPIHAHGGGTAAGGVLAVAAGIAYAAGSAVAAVRTGIRLDRVQYASMAASTALMALASA